VSQGEHSRRLLLIVNPHAGRGIHPAGIEQAVTGWKRAGIITEVRTTQRAGHALEMVKNESLESCDGICVYGGDGTLREVISGLLARQDGCCPPVGALPGGTGNSLLMHGGDDDWCRAVAAIAQGATTPLDVARVILATETTYCANLIGWSSAAQISATAERWRWLGAARYSLAALWQIVRARPEHLVVTIDGERIEDDFLLVLACNTRYGGRRMLIAPQARTDDGRLDLLLVRQASRRQMLQLFSRIYDGRHVELPFVEVRTVCNLTVEQDRPAPITLDGDLGTSQRASIEVLPAALRLFA
jgi:YegS/Rv2252/BmrU family lipid kinase